MTEVSGSKSRQETWEGNVMGGSGGSSPWERWWCNGSYTSLTLREAIRSLLCTLVKNLTSGLPGQGQPRLADHCQSQCPLVHQDLVAFSSSPTHITAHPPGHYVELQWPQIQRRDLITEHIIS